MKRCICKQQLVSSECLVTKGSWQRGQYSSRLEHIWNRFEHKHVAYSGGESPFSLSQSQSVKANKQSLGIKIHLQLYLNSLKSLSLFFTLNICSHIKSDYIYRHQASSASILPQAALLLSHSFSFGPQACCARALLCPCLCYPTFLQSSGEN